MSVHYKFKSALEYDTITFDGLHISVKDLKNSIIQQKRIGKSTDFDLQVTNAQTKEVYTDENVLIPKNTSLLIARIPNVTQSKSKQWEGYGGDSSPTVKVDDAGPIAKTADLSSLDAPEDDKIKAMMSQSTQDYDPSNYQKIRGANQMGPVPPSYRCYKCHQTGHWIRDCTFSLSGGEALEIKKSTGIPQSFMVPVDGPQVPGAMMTPNGSYAVPVLDHQAYNFKPVPAPVMQEPKPDIPEDLVCSICSDLLADAVMIPCCGNSFCDECIRFFLLESEDHECPDCHEKDISPGTLIPNRFLRKSVANFKNTTGYVKKPIFRPPPREIVVKQDLPAEQPQQEKGETDEQKTVISEADSTEQAKNKQDGDSTESIKSAETSESEPLKEGPPGVSPKESPKGSQIRVRDSSSRNETNGRPKKRDDYSPRLKSSHSTTSRRSPSTFERERNAEDRPGTPTVDEPGIGSNNYQYNNGPPQTGIGNMMSMPAVQGPPQSIGHTYPPNSQPINTFPPTTGPPPNFRLPPPGNVPYMPPGYANPPRPMFDPSRPPMTGPPPFNSGFPPRPPHHREFDRRMRNRTPPGVIDDPLAAFNRMIREKDERERRAKQRLQRRTYSRSRSRSRSFSPRSPRRMRSRSPRRRSRSRSFSMSRRYKDNHPPERRDRDEYEREFRRDDRDYPPNRDHPPRRERDDRAEREYRSFDNFEDKYRGPKGQWGNHSMGMRAPPEAYYNPPPPEITQSAYQPPPNRYPPTRDYSGSYMNKPDPMMISSHSAPTRKYDDIAPPGVEEPPIPGLENSPRIEDKFSRTGEPNSEIKGKDEKRSKTHKDSDKTHRSDRDKEREKHRSERDKDGKRESRKEKDVDRKRRSNRSTTPTKKRSRSRERESPDKRRKKHDESSDRERSDKERKKDHSDEDKLKRSKDKKKKKEKEKKEKEKRKREKKERHKEKDKERKHKEETKEKERHVVEENEEEQRIEPVKEEIPTQRFKSESPKQVEEKVEEEQKAGLYDDVIEENVESEIKELYEHPGQSTPEINSDLVSNKEEVDEIEEGELDQSRDYDDSERDILELHSNDIDLKTELEVRNEMLAHLPEKSKWEDDDENLGEFSPTELKGDAKNSKSGTVSNEVLKRAENAIFAKAINAIRPIEIKKISADRAKFYSGEKEEIVDKPVVVQVVAVEKRPEKKIEQLPPPVKLSVKERLGIKVNEPDPIIRLDRVSPFSRRIADRKYSHGERRLEGDDRKREDRHRRDVRTRDNRREREKDVRRDKEVQKSREASHRKDEKTDRARIKTKPKEVEKKKRSGSRSESEDRKDKRKKKEKKHREKLKKKDDKDEKQKDEKQETLKSATDKRKPTLDEASFEPDYDLESDVEDKKDEEESSSSDSSSTSSSEEERRKKKRKKHRKKKYRKDSSSSSSDSESDSSDEERERKRKKHKKNKKKKKKSKHK